MITEMTYAEKIQSAALVFPIVAAVFTVIYIIWEYHKYGALHFFKAFIVYSFIFYMLCAYFLVIMPLPTRTEVAAMTTSYLQLNPFAFMEEGHDHMETFLNCLLLLPLGFYLRYYFRRTFPQTLLIVFAVTLFFELTQLSGLYGIYPRPYRVFDVNDLMTNTFGGMAGWLIVPVFRFLPKREDMDEYEKERGKTVSAPRRFVAFSIDLAVISVVYIAVKELHLNLHGPVFSTRLGIRLSDILSNYMFLFCLYFMLIPIISNGRTIGKILVSIRLVNTDPARKSRLGFLIRNILHFGCFILMPYLTWFFIGDSLKRGILSAACGIVFIFCVMLSINEAVHHKPRFYEVISGTSEISDISY